MRVRDLRALQDQARRSECSKHPGKLLLILNDEITCWFCEGPPQSFTTLPSETHKYMTGNTQSAAIHSKMARKHGAWDMTTGVTDIALIEPKESQIIAIGKRFTDQVEGFGNNLPEGDQVMAAQLSIAGFQHFHLNVYKGRLLLNMRGREFNARRTMGNRFGGVTLEIITDKAIQQAIGLFDGEILVKATLHENVGDRVIVSMEDYGRAGGPFEQNPLAVKVEHATSGDGKPYIKGGKALQMATARAKCRVLIAGAPLGVDIGTFSEEVGTVVVSDGEGQVAALTERTSATWPEPDPNPGATYPAEDDSVPVDTTTGEITETVNRNNAENRQELADRLKANGITKKQVESLDVPPSQMLIEGKEPHFIADVISDLLKPAEPQVRVEGDDEVQELPW